MGRGSGLLAPRLEPAGSRAQRPRWPASLGCTGIIACLCCEQDAGLEALGAPFPRFPLSLLCLQPC